MDTISNNQQIVKPKKVKQQIILEVIEEVLPNALVALAAADKEKVTNKGTGAGGSNTNYFGKKFEEKTNNEPRLLETGFTKTIINKKTKFGYYLTKTFEDKTVTFVSQNGLKEYIHLKYGIELFRCPDEAYVFEYTDGKKVIKILEKKEQMVDGSVDTKLLTGPMFKEEYFEALEGIFEVEYAFCVSSFLQNKIQHVDNKKYVIFNKLMKKHNIPILFGDDENYFESLDAYLLPNCS
jgi:hypothetical protein